MPRRPTIHTLEPIEWFPCLITTCQRKFRTIGGHTKHIQARHIGYVPHLQDILEAPRTPSPLMSGSNLSL
jgi:hypothetical protein